MQKLGKLAVFGRALNRSGTLKKTVGFISIMVWWAVSVFSAHAVEASPVILPLDMDGLKTELTMVRGMVRGKEKSDRVWPVKVTYEHETYDFRNNVFHREMKTVEIEKKPSRIIPHAVGVAEILWAICPRDRIVAFNEFSADPEFCFIADAVKKRGPVFKSKQTELVIGFQPDLVFMVFYSGSAFREKLNQAKIPYFDLGYFGTIGSIKKQILLIGKIIGEEENAEELVKTINRNMSKIQKMLPVLDSPKRVLYYDEGGYIPGKISNFNSICDIIGAVNVGGEQGVKSWAQVDNETLLSWNPDIIIVPTGSGLKDQLMADKVLSYSNAVKDNKIYEIPGVYLRVDSQFILLSANLLAGIVYENEF